MKKLSINSFKQACGFIFENGRSLEKRILQNYFNNGDSKEILDELEKFQNEDGGFGSGLESDFRLPLSSPMATYNAFTHLEKYDYDPKAIKIIKLGVNYFENTFIAKRNGWFVVPKEVNDYAHAPWWHFIENEGMTIVDRNWGNTTAGIIAYLYKYRDYVSTLNIDVLLTYAIDYLIKKDTFKSESEVYCFIKLYELMPDDISKKIVDKLTFAVQELVCDKKEDWDKYVPEPLHFVKSPESNRFGISDELLEENLDYLIETLESNGNINTSWDWHALESMIDPDWNWDAYDCEWEKAKKEWTGVLTLNALITLDKFNRIEWN